MFLSTQGKQTPTNWEATGIGHPGVKQWVSNTLKHKNKVKLKYNLHETRLTLQAYEYFQL